MFKVFTILLVAIITRSITVAEPQHGDIPDYGTEDILFSSESSSEEVTSSEVPSESKEVELPLPEVLPRDKDFDCIGNWTYLCTQSKKMGKNGCPEMEKVDTFVFEECQLNNLFSGPLMDCCTCYEPGQERCANPSPFH